MKKNISQLYLTYFYPEIKYLLSISSIEFPDLFSFYNSFYNSYNITVILLFLR